MSACAALMMHRTWLQPSGVRPICWPIVMVTAHRQQADSLRALRTRLAGADVFTSGPRDGYDGSPALLYTRVGG